jgi:non-homologous end joining protein Ku
MLKLAEQILQSKATDFDPSQFVDRYEEALIELLTASGPAFRYGPRLRGRDRRTP